VSFYKEHEKGVEFVEGVESAEEVAWIAVCCDGKEVAKRRRDEG